MLLAVDLVMSAYAFKNAGTLFLSTPPRTLGIILIPLLVPFVAIETGAALRWVSNGFDGAEPFLDSSWAISALEIKLTSVLNPIIPRLSLLLLAGWLMAFTACMWRVTIPNRYYPHFAGLRPWSPSTELCSTWLSLLSRSLRFRCRRPTLIFASLPGASA